MENKYLQSYTGDIFKVTPEHLLKISPWEDGEDRRVFVDNYEGYSVITYKNACMIVNSQFDNKVENWEHKGKKYIANSIGDNKNVIEHSYLLSTLPSHNVLVKESKNLLSTIGNNSLTITSEDGTQELKMVKHKGKIYYIMIIKEYLPRVKAYNMFGEFVQWIGIKHCKPIFCETDMRYI